MKDYTNDHKARHRALCPAHTSATFCTCARDIDPPTFHMAQQKLRRDLVRLCRELGLPGSAVQRAARGQHLKVFDATGRLLTSVASTPRSYEDTLMMARRDIRAGLVHTNSVSFAIRALPDRETDQ